jgi:hypothetical protein
LVADLTTRVGRDVTQTKLENWIAKAGNAFRHFWQVLEAMEDGPYGYMSDRITQLEEKVRRYETSGLGREPAEKTAGEIE